MTAAAGRPAAPPGAVPARLLLARLRAEPPGLVEGLGFALVVTALAAPLLHYPIGADVNPAAASEGPSPAHLLGTDHLGRDVLARAILATRAFVGPGLVATGLAVAIGVPLGAWAGWPRGPLRRPAQVVAAALAAVPPVVLVLLLSAAWGAGPVAWAVGAGLGFAPTVADTVRERIERLGVESVVEAALAHGFSERRVLWLHLVGLGAGRRVLRRAAELFGAFAALECALSYVGRLGVPEPEPSWGNMVAFEWGWPLSLATLVPAGLLWLTAALGGAGAARFAERG